MSRNGYYHYLETQEERTDPVHEEMIEWVKEIAKSSKGTYGSRRMKKALSALGYSVSQNKARKLICDALRMEVWRRRPKESE